MIPPRPFSVVVIGGGLAGLSAVQTLIRESLQQQQQQDPSSTSINTPPLLPPMHITLLEAKDRLGGRMHTISLTKKAMNDAATATASTNDDDDDDDDDTKTTTSVAVADMGGMYFHGQGSVLASLQEAFPTWKTIGSGGDSAIPCGQDAIYKVYQQNSNNSNNDNHLTTFARDLTLVEKQEILDLYQEWMNDMQKRFHEYKNNMNNNNVDNELSSHPALLSKWSDEFCNTRFLHQQQQQQQSNNDNTKEEEEKIKEEQQQQQQQQQRQGLEFYKRMHFDLDFAIAWPNVAMNGLMNDWGCCDLNGDDIISVHGMRTLIHAMELQLLQETSSSSAAAASNTPGNTPPMLTIRKQTRVERIEYYNNNDMMDDCSQSTRCRIVTLSDDQQSIFEADACICTIPLGVLKKRATMQELFVPPLPSDKLQALERAGVGTLNTLVVQWKKPIHGYCRCDHDDDDDDDYSKNNKSTSTNTAPAALASAYYLIGATAVDKRNTNPLWHGFVCPGVLRNQADAAITQFHFYETENLSFDDMDFWKQQALQVVQAVVGNSSNKNNKPCVGLDDIVDIHVSAWHLDPDFLGSYSAPTTNTRGNEDRKILAEPIQPAGLYFAGEHTHYEGRFATMDGAYETGIRAARQVLQQLKAAVADAAGA